MESPLPRPLRDLFGGRYRASSRLPPDARTIPEAEVWLQHRRAEWAYVFDRDGRQRFRKRGVGAFVSFDEAELAELRDAIVVHNHPPYREYPPSDPRYEGRTFSATDLDLALRADVSEIRAVTPGWRYVAVRPALGWPTNADTLAMFYTERREQVRNELREAFVLGLISEAERDARLVDELVRRVANHVGFEYRRERL